MRPIQMMVLAGEPSGDALGAELVSAIKRQVVGQVHPHCFGLGGPRLKEAGVELLFREGHDPQNPLVNTNRKVWKMRESNSLGLLGGPPKVNPKIG